MMNYIASILVGAWSLVKGLRVTIGNMCRRAVTVQYPRQKLEMEERYRGLVDLRREDCIMCLQCAKTCPTGCLSITVKTGEDKKRVLETFTYNMEYCCFCGFCEQVCPKSAIRMSKIYEVTAYDRNRLKIDLLKEGKYDEWANPPTE